MCRTVVYVEESGGVYIAILMCERLTDTLSLGQVVMAATRAFYYLAPPSRHSIFVNPLLRLLHTSEEVERVLLSYIDVIASDEPVRYPIALSPQLWH